MPILLEGFATDSGFAEAAFLVSEGRVTREALRTSPP
jgi:hypothetical protein